MFRYTPLENGNDFFFLFCFSTLLTAETLVRRTNLADLLQTLQVVPTHVHWRGGSPYAALGQNNQRKFPPYDGPYHPPPWRQRDIIDNHFLQTFEDYRPKNHLCVELFVDPFVPPMSFCHRYERTHLWKNRSRVDRYSKCIDSLSLRRTPAVPVNIAAHFEWCPPLALTSVLPCHRHHVAIRSRPKARIVVNNTSCICEKSYHKRRTLYGILWKTISHRVSHRHNDPNLT